MSILKAENLNKKFYHTTALKDLNLEIPKQSIFGLLGPNGAGKSTFIRIVNQIIDADSGKIFINDELLSPKHIGTIGYLPEERGLYKKMKIGDQLLYLAQLKGLSKADAKNKIKSWLKRFEAEDWLPKKVEDLSKGMQQKIQFISTVMHEPELIILDEPFSGFDPVNANLIKDEILRLRENGSTIIFSTHRMESVEEMCDEIALIHKSEKILEGKKNEIRKQYKPNIFRFKTHQDQVLDQNLQIVDTKQEEDIKYFDIKLSDTDSPNELIRKVLDSGVEIYGVEELMPSINEIFIDLVQPKNK